MDKIAILLGISVGIINLMLNMAVKKSANVNESFSSSVCSLNFLLAYAIGTVSVLTMLYFYYNATKMNIAQAMLLMAASSAVSSVVIDKLYYKASLPIFEWIVFFTLIALYGYKFLKTLA